jgi:Arm DNA-binding domain
MTTKALTAMAVAAAKPRPKRYEIPDGGVLGLYLVVQPTGAKSWARRAWRNSKSVKYTLGSAAELTLGEARTRAAEIGRLLEQGIDPAAHQRTMPVSHDDDSVEALSALFIERHAKKRRTWQTTEDTFRRLVLPSWRGRRVQDIRRRDVIELVERIALDRPYMANRTLALLSKFFGWLVARDITEVSPATGIDRPGQESRPVILPTGRLAS